MVVLATVLLTVAAGCSSSADTATTITEPVVVTTLPSTTTSTMSPSTTLPPISQLSPPAYRIVERVPTEGPGDEVVVLLDPSSYDTLTDLDLYDLIAEVVELFPPIATLHVVDDAAAANAVAASDTSTTETPPPSEHYLARLENGFRIIYLGPFAASGTAVLGS
jgi:hypothetical protein